MYPFGNADRDDVWFWIKLTIIFGVTFGGTLLVWHRMGEVPLNRFPYHPPANDISADELLPNARPAAGVSPSAGAYGDSFGYVNSLLSSLALAGAIAAIVLQSMELKAQRKELKQSQLTWADQANALRVQSQTMEAQTRVMHEQMLVQRVQNELAVLQAKASASLLTDNGPILSKIETVEKQIMARRKRANYLTRLRAQSAVGFGMQLLDAKHLGNASRFVKFCERFLEEVAFDMAHFSTVKEVEAALERFRRAANWGPDAEADLTRVVKLIDSIDKELPGESPSDDMLKHQG